MVNLESRGDAQAHAGHVRLTTRRNASAVTTSTSITPYQALSVSPNVPSHNTNSANHHCSTVTPVPPPAPPAHPPQPANNALPHSSTSTRPVYQHAHPNTSHPHRQQSIRQPQQKNASPAPPHASNAPPLPLSV